MEYTRSQCQAIDTLDGNLQIIACAGSGKTQVISQRIVRILGDKGTEGVGPANIVAFTFTEKAAGELKDRIHRLCKEQFGHDTGLADMYVGTIHGFCLDLLQTYAHQFLKYSVLSDVQQRLLIDRHSNESGLSALTTHDGKPLKRWVDSRLYQRLLGMVREAEIDEAALGHHPIRAALASYTELLHKKRYLDYSMLLTEAVRAVASDPNLRAKLAERVKYLIIDEYQDVNPLQEGLIRQLSQLGAEVCVVGDDDQTIYQWNGSDVGNILGFADRYAEVTRVEMGENFRSSPGVVDSARRVAEGNAERLPKTMQSMDKQVYEQGDLLALAFRSPEDEAAWIVDKIRRLRGRPFTENDDTRGLTWSDCAILLRSVKNSAEPIVAALREAGIPYLIKGMNRLFETPEIQAARAIFFYLNDEIGFGDLREAWLAADLGIDPDILAQAVEWLDRERADWPNRWLTSARSPQRSFLGFLEQLGLREESIGGDALLGRARGEIVYYNLGKFSQIITDYELIHFHSDAKSLYGGFAGFLRHQAADYYPEGWEDSGYARPDAVQIMTIHQAKGMEFPVVFVPNLVKNRFPGKRQGGRQWYHIIPREAVVGADLYLGTEQDERRLFYVALTRSKKYLFCSWAPEGSNLYSKESPFMREFVAGGYALTREPARPEPTPIEPRPATALAEIALTFSELKYLFECPYQFKLRFLYGFNPGYNERLGYGKSLHDVLAEVHRRTLDGEHLDGDSVPALLDTHFHLPFGWDELREDMKAKADQVLRRYFRENAEVLDKIEHAEKIIELKLADGVVVHGRIDLIRRTDTNQIIIIDFKSTDRVQAEDVTRDQLHIYALGYQQLTGKPADLVEIYNLDEGSGASVRELVDHGLLADTEERVVAAGTRIRDGGLDRITACGICAACDFVGICRSDAEVK
jgi:DNA helicase-2/ATP-dependent DNA helicase PcrA